MIDQAALAEFINSGQYDRHLRRLRLVCEERYQAMQSHFARALDGQLRLSQASAGTHLLARFPPTLSGNRGLATRVSRLAEAEGMVIFPLSRYCLSPPAHDALILGFGGLSPRRIATGAERLRAIIRHARQS